MLDLNPDTLNLDDKPTWDLFCSGKTKGVFQLETPLGRSYSKKVQPRSIRELADLIAILRPGCLEAYMDDKNITNHYIDRKFKREPVTYLHPALEDLLKDTYGLLIYQEQAIAIVKALAGFDGGESEDLRKAMGKKLPEEMSKVEKKFLEGATKTGVLTSEEAIEVFSWIRKSQRYSFNLSHSVEYAITGYLSAYLKANHPLEFYCAWLRHADEKMTPFAEIKELVNDARIKGVDVLRPNIRKSENNFLIKDGKIYFGLTNIKGLGISAVTKVRLSMFDKLKCDKPDIWLDFLLKVAVPNYSACRTLISVGAMPYKMTRTKMLFELELAKKLTDRELAAEISGCDNLEDWLNKLHDSSIPNKRRKITIVDMIKTLRETPHSLEDDPEWISNIEHELLGVSMTCNKIESRDTFQANTTCLEFTKHPIADPVIAATVVECKEFVIKKGKNEGQKMGFLKVDDGTCELECTLFNTAYEYFKGILNPGGTVLVMGKIGRQGGLVVDNVVEI